MAEVTTKTFTDLVRGQAAAIQAGASGLVDFSVGSILRAITEAIAAVVLWLQGLILALLATTRASTSVGPDLDSWMADFGLTRLPAQAATGEVTFSRLTPTLQVVVPVGTTVESRDGTQQYVVVADTANSAYSADEAGYVIEPSVASVTVPVQAQTAGAAGNAVAGAINTITQATPGIDQVTNELDFVNGGDAETDAAFRLRFQNFLASLSKGVKAAIEFAVTSLQQGVTVTIDENVTYAGVDRDGWFSVVVDDGTGAPTSDFITAAAAAVEATRAISIGYEVHGPTVVDADIVMVLDVAAGYGEATVASEVETALRSYVNLLGLGNALRFTRLAQIAYDASAGVTNVSGVTLNGGTSDLVATAKQTIKADDVSVTT